MAKKNQTHSLKTAASEIFQSAIGQISKTKDDISVKVTQEILDLVKKN